MGCPSGQEYLLIVFVAILIFGASRLPQLGDALGRAIRNFKSGYRGDNEIDVTPKNDRELSEGDKDQKPPKGE